MKLNKGDWYVIYRALELARNSDVGSFYREETMEKVKEKLFGGEDGSAYHAGYVGGRANGEDRARGCGPSRGDRHSAQGETAVRNGAYNSCGAGIPSGCPGTAP